jgi:hypothetical protein
VLSGASLPARHNARNATSKLNCLNACGRV